MFHNNLTLVTKWQKRLFWLTALLLIAVVTACGGQAGEEVALSEQVPPRRGAVDTLAEVQEIAAEVLGVPEAEVVEEADFRQDLDADDDEMARLAEAFEEAFNIVLTNEEINDLTTVRSAVDLIESK